GSVVIGGFAVNEIQTWNFVKPLLEDADVERLSENPPTVYGFGHTEFYKDVLDCIANNKRSMLDGLEGRKSVELINAIYESAVTAREVRLRYVPRGVALGL